MTLLFIALGLFLFGSLSAPLTSRHPGLASRLGGGVAALACLAGLAGALPALAAPAQSCSLPWIAAWGGRLSLGLDPLSAVFLAAIFGLGLAVSVHGIAYASHGGLRDRAGASWLFVHLLFAGMTLVCLARDGLLFLLAWELMALASYFLVTIEDRHESTVRAGWIYLVATHLGTACLMVLFVSLSAGGTFGFDHFERAVRSGAMPAAAVFGLALAGFGSKAGFVPLHVWLPEAHPAAPSHVSALMSGAMIKTGLYGLLRVLAWCGEPPLWWGGVLVAVGVVSGLAGILLALAQRDLKRLLAYSSVENVGIAAIGFGLGLAGASLHRPALAVLGFAGGLLHVLNHALFKGLLFLGAGSVVYATGERNLDRLGGLARRMPGTAAAFAVGAAAICGLPPLNGFFGEFALYLGAFGALAGRAPGAAGLALAAILALALIGGLAAACFAKAFGVAFLGEPRTEGARDAVETPVPMRLGLYLPAAACVGLGLAAPWLLPVLARATGPLAGLGPDAAAAAAAPLQPAFLCAATASAGLWLTIGMFAVWRRLRLAGRSVESSVTWDCGYSRPTPRMQYTGTSFSDPLTRLFEWLLRTRRERRPPDGLFPSSARIETGTPDPVLQSVFAPFFGKALDAMLWLRRLQHGRLQIYVLYIALTLVALLLWKTGGRP